MKALFTPFRIGNLALQNRIVLPALASFLVGEEGALSDDTVHHYRMRAAGGPAMVIMEACAVSPEGVVSPNQARIDADHHVDWLSRIARAIASQGAIPAVQIHHAGRQTSARVIGRPPLAPSPLPCPTIRGDVDPLDIDRIQKLVTRFGDAAVRARQAGFKLVEIHGAHGYLVNQFLSSYSNVRQDEYGGDINGRARFAVEIVREIKRRVGSYFPVSFKISAQEFVPGGLTVEQSIELLRLLSQAGVDIVQVSAGNDATPEWICQPMFMEKGCLVESAHRIKQALDIPVMAVGRINNPILADRIVAEQKADLVCIGRGLMADPRLPLKALAGRLEDIRTCIACNTCMESIFKKGRLECLVNPSLGREKQMQIIPTDSPKQVMVIGGGPGGLNVAWVAAKRGHRVHLYEKTASLGGKLITGSVPGYKQELKNLIRYQVHQIEKHGVVCHLNQEVTPAVVQARNPDVVVLANGSLPLPLPLEVTTGPPVIAFDSILNGQRPEALETVVVGGGATGCEVAHYLSETGSRVTVVEQLDRIGNDLETVTRRVLLSKLKEKGVKLLPGTRVEKVSRKGIWLSGRTSGSQWLATQRIVVAVGTRSDNSLYDQVTALGYKVYQIGDCVEPRTAKAAIYEGAVLGRSL